MAPPSKLAHVVFRTPNLAPMKAWYCSVLEARVQYSNSAIAFLTYDDEHHRLALVSLGEFDAERGNGPGLEHVGFTYPSLKALLETYERLKGEGILPYWTVNHGPTTSFYYEDPDGNRIELQVENFRTRDELDEFFRSGAFKRNPIGVNFDPEALLGWFRAGVSDADLLKPDW